MKPRVLGLDVGGANLKSAHIDGSARTRPFAVWKHPDLLAQEIRRILAEGPSFDLLSLTMTAELCDCFETKCAGVNAILDAVESAAEGKPILVWRNDGQFASFAKAREETLKTASANWLALATLAGRYCSSGPALLIDIGSTTTDIVPIIDRQPVPQGRTDLDRLAAEELLYRGVRRTPVCALPWIFFDWKGRSVKPAAELFATVEDAYILLGDLPEDAGNCETADGRPATAAYARARLARMICTDAITVAEAKDLAEQIHCVLCQDLFGAIYEVRKRLPTPLNTAVISGAGEFLARIVLNSEHFKPLEIVSLNDQLGPEVSKAACAYAIAVLATERSES